MKPAMTAAQKFVANAYGALRLDLKLPVVEWKPLVLDRATLNAIERAADPYRRLPGDGRG